MKFILILLIPCFASTSYAIELTETKAIQIFMEKNLDVMASKFDIQITRAEEITAGLWANPSLFVDSQLNPFGKNWNQKNAGGPTQQDIVLTVPIDVNGKRRQAVKVAKLATKVAEAEFQTFVRENIISLLDTLYSFQKLKREFELLQEKSQLLEKLILTLEKRVGGATNQPLIQNRAKLAFEDVRVEIQKNKIEQKAEENKLKTALVLDLAEEINLSLQFKSSLDQKFDVKDLVENGIKNRPDFQGLRLLKEQLNEQVDLDRKRIWDDVGVQAGVARQHQIDKNPENPDSNKFPTAWSWVVGVTVPIPVFDRNQGSIMQSKLRTNQILVKERLMQETLSKEIETSVMKLELTNLNLSRYKSAQLTSARTVRDSALRQFGTGSTTLLEYLDAVDAYHTAINKYIEAQYDLTTEYQRLKLLSGQEIGL